MKRPTSVIAATALATMTVAAVAGGSAAQADTTHPAGATVTVPNSAVPFATANRAMGAVAASQQLTIQVWLKPRTAAAESYATAVSTPGSALYQHYLSPAAYAARFGASKAAAAGVETWLKSDGFSGVAADAGRDYVQASAPVSTINAAFHVELKYYRATSQVNAGKYALRANDRAVSLPSSIGGSVLGVTGLDNAAPKQMWVRPSDPAAASLAPAGKPIAFPCSSYYAQHYARRLPRVFGTINIPTIICGYSADQVRRAYGYDRHNIGKGVTIALVEVGLTPDMLLTLQDYAKANRIQAPSPSRYSELSLGKGSACGDPFNIEEQLDVEASYDMAPLSNQLVVGGDSCNNGFFGLQAVFDADTAILNGVGGHPLAQIASNSWEAADETIPVNLLNIEHAYLVRAAAEGVSMLFSSGDGSGVENPSSDPFATAVGGTTLGIGNKVARLFETGWSTEVSLDINNKWINEGEGFGGAGGGPSLLWAQPAYQRGVVPAWLATAPGNRGGLVRAVPDIGALADPATGINVGLLTFDNKGNPNGFTELSFGGTSVSSPLVAGLVADAEQNQHHSFGFLNPALYRLAGTSAVNLVTQTTSKTPARYRGIACDVADCGALLLATFDVESYSMLGYTGQVTRRGYGTMAGIGSPAGQNFIYALRKLG
ncbi:MAG TPA: protease pro-enzyme activation domain-containing protein [Trebonia sp.]|nr:protease pro-enzyme activation domain-containing protein [Trebonia sp.]